VIAVLAATGVEFGLLVSGLGFGFRHGIDWDHIAAITDVTSSQPNRRAALWLGTLYAFGHASVVFALGMAAIIFGERLPPGIDDVMTRVESPSFCSGCTSSSR
jgi:high-affinity nickel permease